MLERFPVNPVLPAQDGDRGRAFCVTAVLLAGAAAAAGAALTLARRRTLVAA